MHVFYLKLFIFISVASKTPNPGLNHQCSKYSPYTGIQRRLQTKKCQCHRQNSYRSKSLRQIWSQICTSYCHSI